MKPMDFEPQSPFVSPTVSPWKAPWKLSTQTPSDLSDCAVQLFSKDWIVMIQKIQCELTHIDIHVTWNAWFSFFSCVMSTLCWDLRFVDFIHPISMKTIEDYWRLILFLSQLNLFVSLADPPAKAEDHGLRIDQQCNPGAAVEFHQTGQDQNEGQNLSGNVWYLECSN